MEMMRTLRVARQSAVKARTQAANELHALVVTAPDALRAQLRQLRLPQLVTRAAAFRRSTHQLSTPTATTKLALKSIAMRYQHLSVEIHELDKHLDKLVAGAAPALVAIKGVGIDIAATLLIVAGDNPERLARSLAIASIAAATARVTERCICWPWVVCAGIQPPVPMSNGAPLTVVRSPKSSAASSGTLPASSIHCSWQLPPHSSQSILQ
jgi:hypothetical protein